MELRQLSYIGPELNPKILYRILHFAARKHFRNCSVSAPALCRSPHGLKAEAMSQH
jgi:hypothetical protein